VRSTWSALDEHGDSVNPLTVKYLNRLSDLLFILSRVASTDSHGGTGDILWVPPWGARPARLPEGDGAAARPRQP
jgi:cob(I)alamin adenosyltransferase